MAMVTTMMIPVHHCCHCVQYHITMMIITMMMIINHNQHGCNANNNQKWPVGKRWWAPLQAMSKYKHCSHQHQRLNGPRQLLKSTDGIGVAWHVTIITHQGHIKEVFQIIREGRKGRYRSDLRSIKRCLCMSIMDCPDGLLDLGCLSRFTSNCALASKCDRKILQTCCIIPQ